CPAPHRRLPPFPTRRSSDLTQRSEREALRRQRADDELRDELREFLRGEGVASAARGLGFAQTVGAILCALLLFPIAQRVVAWMRSEEHTSELQSRGHLVCRL